jgi:hypothetical protein
MNITAKTLYKTGSVSMMIIGAGHTAVHFALAGNDPASAPLITQMEAFKITVLGSGSPSLLDFHQGFSITMGMLLLFTGLQNFFLSGNLSSAFNKHKGSVLLPSLLAGITFILSLKYFFIVPQALSPIALIAYSSSFWKLQRELDLQRSGIIFR